MSRPELRRLQRDLLAADVAPRFVFRTLEELRDHCEDIESDALAAGHAPFRARALARASLGTNEDIVAVVSSRPELLRWPRRWPLAARIAYTCCYYALLPAAPFVYCTEHGSAIVRWSLSTSLAALLTGAMLLSMHWLIL
jgi:hypothetical protein